MRFMLIVRATPDSEAGILPPMELLEEMGRFNEEMAKAGVMLAGEGLQASSKGAMVTFTPGRKPSVTDGPYAETKELIAGFWIIKVNSREEAIEWARRSPAPFGPNQEGRIEVRQLFDPEDFGREIAEKENALREQIGQGRA